MTKEDFNKTVHVSDIVYIYGVENKLIPCVVVDKTEYACNLITLLTVEGDDGIIRPEGSYYRTYDEIVNSFPATEHSKGLYKHYKSLGDERIDNYEKWLEINREFLTRFIKENISIKVENESDYFGIESYNAKIFVSEH